MKKKKKKHQKKRGVGRRTGTARSGTAPPRPDRAWAAAEWRYSALIADSILPFFGPEPSREEQARRLRAILDDCPTFYPALFQLGVLESADGRADESRRLLLEGADRMAERLPSLDEDYVRALDGIIEPLEEGLRYDLSRELLERLCRLYPAEPRYRSELGTALVCLGEWEEAVRNCEEAVAAAPENAHFHGNLGWVHLEAGRLDRARAHLERSLVLEPDNESTRWKLDVLSALELGNGGSFTDYLLRPLDRDEIARVEARCDETGDYHELDEAVHQWNHSRLEAWKRHLCRTREPADYPELFKSVRAFFRLFEKLDSGPYTLYEELDLLDTRFEPLVHRLIVQMSDVDEVILGEICGGLLSFYGYLAEQDVVDARTFAGFRSTVHRLKPVLVEKAVRYAGIRDDDSVPEEEKERIRHELFHGDHLWLGI